MSGNPRTAGRRRACAALIAAALLPLAARAQTAAPPITLVVPFPPGGPTDVVARSVAQHMGETLGQTLIVTNRPGAGGSIGSSAVAHAAPDGLTLLVGTAALMTNPYLYKLNFDPLKDLRAIALLAKTPVFIWVDSRSPFKDLSELLAAVKARPGQYNYSSSAPTTLAHLGSLRLFEEAGAKATHINYKGSAQATTDFLGGVFPIYFEVGQPLAPHLAAGKVRPLAVVERKRSPLMPDVPSITEFGLPAFDAEPFMVLLAPRDTPEPVVARLNEHARRALQASSVRDKLRSLYFEVSDGGEPSAVQDWLRAQSTEWGEVIVKHGLKAE
ncbi:Bug family tripartite tricarboxylate transporter substrate binding protein [Achromobacter denitrificans]|uniref:Bug family tripartite tricarboxylate transporter substrate binding protein n=1 Tax=Achromobacter denitrificans TaxID=32002 RepID=UPI0023E87342|nr:tripartite tricarboxylate transporter substrate binding protein [Achromobacter denitrificans]MDF3860811.1 tripartite tricarboxylate transporter substrate binding protein [Achromobacter denitrificans]